MHRVVDRDPLRAAAAPDAVGPLRLDARGPEDELGAYYAQRTILKREVVPENVADAVYVLTGPELTRTTGLHIPVDSGVAAAFLR